jgi:YgiT-type zinc finger domain-containing protein
MKRGLAPFSLDRHGYHIAWDAIPAWVCTQCGKPYFESKEVELIQNVLSAVDQQMVHLGVAEAS